MYALHRQVRATLNRHLRVDPSGLGVRGHRGGIVSPLHDRYHLDRPDPKAYRHRGIRGRPNDLPEPRVRDRQGVITRLHGRSPLDRVGLRA